MTSDLTEMCRQLSHVTKLNRDNLSTALKQLREKMVGLQANLKVGLVGKYLTSRDFVMMKGVLFLPYGENGQLQNVHTHSKLLQTNEFL